MTQYKQFKPENCVETSSNCVIWRGGCIEFLGIKDGDTLSQLTWEIVTKLQELAGEDISTFDISSMLDICNTKAPLEVTLISILSLLRDNDVCLKEYILALEERINGLTTSNNATVNLRCYAELDNIGNVLGVTRESLDQLIIDQLCSQKNSIDTLNGKVTGLQAQIDAIDINPVVNEPNINTCLATAKPTSTQVVLAAQVACDQRTATGTVAQIQTATSIYPPEWDTLYGSDEDWIPAVTRNSWADVFNNTMIVIRKLNEDVINIKNNCCAVTCDDIKLGFSVIAGDTASTLVLRFRTVDGTNIPVGFTDCGTVVIVTDIKGNQEQYTIEIENNLISDEFGVSGLDLSEPITINVQTKMCNGTYVCTQCLSRTFDFNADGCPVCLIETEGTGSVTIIYNTND